jgi:mannose/cellobiose epimerase-like protein (N-acyl-D-glucosamine 2-epimerase family)
VLIWLTGDTLIPNPIDQNPWAHWRSHERLDLQGNPIHDVPKRLMVQGRQLYVYCHAGVLGWHSDAQRLADRCVEYTVKSFYRGDGNPGWVHSLAKKMS